MLVLSAFDDLDLKAVSAFDFGICFYFKAGSIVLISKVVDDLDRKLFVTRHLKAFDFGIVLLHLIYMIPSSYHSVIYLLVKSYKHLMCACSVSCA